MGKISLVDYWNGWGKAIAGMEAQDRILRDVLKLGDGKLSQKRLQNLALGGIDESLARRIAKEAANWEQEGGKLWLSRTDKWADPETARLFEAAVLQDVNRSFISPGAGDLPLFMSNPLLSILGQFKSFTFASTQRFFISGMQRADAAVLAGALSSLALGALGYGLSQVARGEAISEDPGVLVAEAMDLYGDRKSVV